MKGKGPGYEINGEIMILAVALLACAVFFTFCLHFYAKWFWRHSAALTLNAALGSSRRRRFTFAETEEEDYGISENVGLEKSVIDALPLFVYRLQSGYEGLDCAVCLCGFEENDKGRLLPNCKHTFHVDCIEMWFISHSTCPLCRTKVQPEQGFSAVEISEDVGSHSEEGGTSSDSAKVPVTRICSLRRLLGRENKVFPSFSDAAPDVEEGGGLVQG
ncbi:RING-H2 finger protein ATL2 [Cryptomeria japonica]|uniref:RING-H2 finger protein ATL2 n=1 Tax=Cryptomeria japonica TaxID=3369 RepID=UPI0025AD9530|nr:RING-H2 finger protein ATL2 [Cryptomeria japonica]